MAQQTTAPRVLVSDALSETAVQIFRDRGIEGLSLREAARRAGVSIGAPAHHFGSTSGLLTEVALLGYDSLGASLNAVQIAELLGNRVLKKG